MQTWLRNNRRPAYLAATSLIAVAAVIAAISLLVDASPTETVEPFAVVMWVICIVLVVSGILVLGHARRPRIGATRGQLHFDVGRGKSTAVPIDVVEAFFMGQGPAQLPTRLPEMESVNLVARISQRAVEWQRRDVDRRIAAWCDGYITIRGTACEPLNADVVRHLNRRLEQVKRDQREEES